MLSFQRMWEFSTGLILLDLHPDSLALIALFGLVDSLGQVLAGPYVGAYIDRHVLPYMVAPKHRLWGKRMFVFVLHADLSLHEAAKHCCAKE